MGDIARTTLQALDEELRAWVGIGAQPQLWWRDDDAYRDSEPLLQLRELLEQEMLVLAIVPGRLQDNLVRSLEDSPTVAIVQHGWKHLNHAAAGALPSEYPPERRRTEIEDELALGQRILLHAFQTRFQRVFVPPWHRCAAWILRESPSLGFFGVSTQAPPFPLLRHGYTGEINIEIDLSDWTLEGQFVGADRVASQIAKALRLRREWSRWEAPIGILSHHQRLVRDDFRALRDVIALLRYHGVRWISSESLFPRGRRVQTPPKA